MMVLLGCFNAIQVTSLGFLVMHARCYPCVDNDRNHLKLACEVALMIVFLCAAVLRSIDIKLDLVDSRRLGGQASAVEHSYPDHG